MDPKSSYLLEIRLVGNPRSRKEFSCFIITMVVDSDICNFKDFVDEIIEKYPPGYKERVSVAYYDVASKNHLEVKSDQELLAMFAKHADSKTVNMAIAYTLPTEIPEWPTTFECISSQPTTFECTSSHPLSTQSTQHTCSQPTIELTSPPSTPQADDDNFLANPEPDNEFVDVDEENMYLSNASKSGASHDAHFSESDYEEEDELEGKDPIQPLIVAYDKEDPPMGEGSTYANMAEFKLALSYFAIKREIEYDTEKSDPGRMILYCSRKVEDGCKWRLYAVNMDDNVSVQVTFVVFMFISRTLAYKLYVVNCCK